MLNEIKLMKPKSKDKLAGRDSIRVIVDTKEEILVYSEPEGGYGQNIAMPDVYKVIHNNVNYNGGDINEKTNEKT